MTARQGIPVLFSLLLAGCFQNEEKIVDLSSAVFIVFIALMVIKHVIPTIVSSAAFSKMSAFIQRYVRHFIYPLYVLATTLIVVGITLSGIHRVHVFSGLVVGVISHNISRLTKCTAPEQKKIPTEIISLGFGILFVLLLLWTLGTDLFKDF
jgi:hypothetical protein